MTTRSRLARLEASVINLPAPALLPYILTLDIPAAGRLLDKISDAQLLALIRLYVEDYAAQYGLSDEEAEQAMAAELQDRDNSVQRGFAAYRKQARSR